MHLSCPNCQTPIDIARWTPGEEIACPSCGSSFNLEGETTTEWGSLRGRTIGKFELLEVVGSGAFGTVFKARDPGLDRLVAIKVPRAGNLASAGQLDRFLREARSLAQLRHPAIVPIHEVGQHEGLPYLVSDFIQGVTLADRLSAGRPTFQEAARLCLAVAEALQAAHQQAVVHRDIKPSNIMLVRDAEGQSFEYEHPFIMDFGLARRDGADVTLTQEGQVLGTPAYMSPEQARGEAHRVDGRSDIYSLGVVLYQMITGELPFRGTKRMLLHQVLHDDPRSPRRLNDRIPVDLETICLKAMAREPRQRYATAQAMADDLKRFLAGLPIHARPVSWLEWRWRWCKRNPVVASMGAALVLVLSVAAIASTWALVVINRDRNAIAEARDEIKDHLANVVEARNRIGELAEHNRQQADQRRDLLVRAHVANGERLLDEGDFFGAMVWFAAALEQDRGDAQREHRHRVRLGNVRRHLPRLLHVWVHEELGGEGDSQLARERLLTVSGKTVCLWDTSTGKARYPEVRLEAAPLNASIHPKKDHIAVCVRMECRLLDLATGKQLLPSLVHDGPVNNALFRRDGKRLVTTCDDGVARLWDVETGKGVGRPLRHGATILQIDFSPDGRYILTGSNDHTARVWDSDSGEPITPPLRHTSVLNCAQFSPDGRLAGTTSHDATARLWDVATGKPVTPPLRHDLFVHDLHFSPDGRKVATGSFDRTARIWDVATGKQLLPPLEHRDAVKAVRFSPDGAFLATSSSTRVHLWNVMTGQAVGPPLEHARDVRWVEFAPDGRRLLTVARDHTVRLWDLGSEPSSPLFLEGEMTLRDPVFSPDGRYLAGGVGAATHLWDLVTGKAAAPPLRQEGTVRELRFSGDGRQLAVVVLRPGAEKPLRRVQRGDTVWVWEMATGKRRAVLTHPDGVHHVDFSPDGDSLVTAGADCTARLWDLTTGKMRGAALPHDEEVVFATFSPDGQRVVTGTQMPGPVIGRRGDARVWDARTGQPVTSPLAHQDGVIHAAFSPDGRWVATASAPGRVWNATTGQPISPWLGHHQMIAQVCFSRDGRRLLTASQDQTARVWDAVTAKPLTAPMPHHSAVFNARFSRDESSIVTVGLDGAARVWDAATGEPLAPPLYPGGPRVTQSMVRTADQEDPSAVPRLTRLGWISDVAFQSDGERLLTIGPRGEVCAWDLSPDRRPVEDLLVLARLLSGRQIDRQGQHVAVNPDQLALDWTHATRRCPDAFLPRPDERLAWHHRQLALLESSRQWKAALAHADRLKAAYPKHVDWYRRSAWIALEAREYRRTIADASRALALDTHDDLLWYLRGEGYRALRQWDKAQGDYSAALERNKGFATYWLRRGEARHKVGQPHEALADLQEAIRRAPRSSEALLLRGLVRMALDQPREALADFTLCVQLHPQTGEIWHARAKAHRMLGQHREAIADLTQVMERAGKSATVWSERAAVYLELSQYREAAHDYTQAIAAGSRSADVWFGRGVCRLALGEIDGAVADFDRLIAVYPERATGWYGRGMCYLRVGQLELAETSLSKAIQLDERMALAWYGRARVWDARKQWARSVADYSRSLALNPRHLESLQGRALAHMAQSNHAQALTDWTAAIRLAPTNWDVWYERGEVYARLGQWEKALSDWMRASRQKNASAILLWKPALVRLHLNDLVEYRALCTLMATRLARTTSPGTALSVAWVCALAPEAVKDPDSVVKLASMASTVEPGNFRRLGTLGAMLFRAGKFTEAREQLHRAVQLNDSSPLTWGYLALTFARLHQPDEAARWLGRMTRWRQQAEAVKPAASIEKPSWVGLPWYERLALQRVQHEAEQALAAAKKKKGG